MRRMVLRIARRISLIAAALSCVLVAKHGRADTFGSGANTFTIDFVTVGQPGNLPDDAPNPAGAVPYTYRMGKYEISEQMIDKANALGALGITKDTRGPNKPATSVTWFEAATFVNWLNTSTGATPAYKFDSSGNFQLWLPSDPGYNAQNLYRNGLAKYFLPSLNEWHKAAYYDPAAGHYWDYPTGSDSIPDGIDFVGDPNFDAVLFDGGVNPFPNDAADVLNAGLSSPNSSVGQGGNVREWVETAYDLTNSSANEQRRTPGGSFSDSSSLMAAWNTLIGVPPGFENQVIGIRVVSSVPEPSSIFLLFLGFKSLLKLRRRK